MTNSATNRDANQPSAATPSSAVPRSRLGCSSAMSSRRGTAGGGRWAGASPSPNPGFQRLGVWGINGAHVDGCLMLVHLDGCLMLVLQCVVVCRRYYGGRGRGCGGHQHDDRLARDVHACVCNHFTPDFQVTRLIRMRWTSCGRPLPPPPAQLSHAAIHTPARFDPILNCYYDPKK